MNGLTSLIVEDATVVTHFINIFKLKYLWTDMCKCIFTEHILFNGNRFRGGVGHGLRKLPVNCRGLGV